VHVLCDTLLLGAPSYRTRAYAQFMAARQIVPDTFVRLPGDPPAWDGVSEITGSLGKRTFCFRPGISAETSLEDMSVHITTAPTADVNGEAFVDYIRSLPHSVVIYSGIGGVLLRRDLLGCGKRFLHVHGGFAPAYRGSTAFYYSILAEGKIGATALWMREEIDAGSVLLRRKYDVLPGVEIDRVLDPVVRADTLMSVLAQRSETGAYPKGEIIEQGARTYFVIHPVLKHLALRRSGLLDGSRGA
jgi:methionyl-tRNA formyltransferase